MQWSSLLKEEFDVDVQYVALGDAGAALNKLILSKKAPLVDLFFGVDNAYFSRALAADIFEEHPSELLDSIEPSLLLDGENRLIPIDHGYIALNADRAYFEEAGRQLPTRLVELGTDSFKDTLVVQNPATSTPGLAFLLGNHQSLRRRWVFGILAIPERPKRSHYRRLVRSLFRAFHGRFRGHGHAPHGRQLFHESSRRPTLRGRWTRDARVGQSGLAGRELSSD